MSTAPASAASAVPFRSSPALAASAVPTATGTTAAVSVTGRQARTHAPSEPARLAGTDGRGATSSTGVPSGQPLEALVVRLPLLDVGVLPLLALFGHVEEQGRVAGELLEAELSVAVGVERALQTAERDRA